MKRDQEVNIQLESKGWIVLRFWGFQIKQDLSEAVDELIGEEGALEDIENAEDAESDVEGASSEEANDDLSDASAAMTMKTTGIKYIIEGISDAFASTCVNNPAPFTSGDKVFTPKVENKPIPILAMIFFLESMV